MKKEQQRLGDVIARLDSSRGFVDNFDRFIDFALFPFLANPTQDEWQRFNECRTQQAYSDALLLLGELSEGYHDALGDIFMECISHGANGQFFTPEHMCEMMAEIVNGSNESICDPTCGSGRFLLAGMKSAREKHETEPYVYGCDLDHRCVRMTLLNVCLNSGRGDIEWGNTLLMDIYKTYHIDRVMLNGRWMSFVWQYDGDTDKEALNKERQETAKKLFSCGVLYELPRRKAKAQETAPEVVEAEEVQAEPVDEKPIPQAQFVPPIQEPERKAPVQLSFDF